MSLALPMNRALLAVMLFALPLGACRRASAGSGVPPVLLLQLERGACMGTCPEYAVSLMDDGTVQYRGTRHVAVTGEQTRRIKAADVRALHREFLAAGVASADSSYGFGNPVCAPYIADLPSSRFTVRVADTYRRIDLDPGCRGAPAYLRDFATRIDQVAGTDAWVRPREETR